MPMPLRVLVAVAILLSIAWAAVTPPLVGPDETAHYGYAQYLAETRDKPQYEAGNGTVSTETGSAMLALNLWPVIGAGEGKPAFHATDLRDWERFEATLGDDARKNGGGPNAVAKNPPLYYAVATAPYHAAAGAGVLDRVFVMRLLNAVFLALTVVLTWLLAAELFRSVLARTVAAAVVALHPLGAYIAGVVNPDTLHAAWWAAFLLLAVRLVLHGPTRWRVLALVGVCGGALLTHGRALPLVAALPVAIGLALWRHRTPIPRAVRWGAVAAVVLLVAVVAAAGSGFYGGELRLGEFSPAQFVSFVWQFYLPKLPFMDARLGPDYGFRQMFVEQYLGMWGALDVRLERDSYRLLQLLVGGGLILFAAAVVARWREVARQWDVFALLAFVVLATLLFLHVVSYRALVVGGNDPLIVGRYLMPLTPIAGLAAAFTVGAARRRAPYAAAVVVGLLVVLQLSGLGASLARFDG